MVGGESSLSPLSELMVCQRCQCVTCCLAHVWEEHSGGREKKLVCLACRRLFVSDDSKKESA